MGQALSKFLHGRWSSRSTVFAAFFAITSFILALKGLLTAQYVAAIGAIHTFVVVRAVVEDVKNGNGGDNGK